jgi:hypothetical protein
MVGQVDTQGRFTSRADRRLLDQLKGIAKAENRTLRSVIEEAFGDLIAKRRCDVLRPTVRAALDRTLQQRELLYRQLAQ